MVVWNKAYRREFVEAEGFTFPPGYYEDTPWTYPVLMAAGSIAVRGPEPATPGPIELSVLRV